MKALLILAAMVALVLTACASVPTSGSIQTSKNIVYESSHDLSLDVYAPAGGKDAPLIVFFGGSRWEHGDKKQYAFVGQALAEKGFVTMVANYRLYPPATYKQFLADCAKAVVWARAHAGQYGASPDKVFVMGFSAGAYNAAMLALDPQWLKAAGGNRDELAGMIGISGPYNFLPITAPDLRTIFWPPSQFKKTQPVYWVNGHNPPVLLIASHANKVANPGDTVTLYQNIKQEGGTVAKVMYRDLSNRDTLRVLATGHQDRADEMKNIVAFVHKSVARTAQRKAQAQRPGIETRPSQSVSGAITTAPVEIPALTPVPAASVPSLATPAGNATP